MIKVGEEMDMLNRKVKVEVRYHGQLSRVVWRCDRCKGTIRNASKFRFCPWCGREFQGEREERLEA